MPADATGVASGVVRHLERSLTVGLIHDGEKLPPEPRLADQLGVSTITLRQALAVLRDRGVIETHRGRGGGSFIRDSEAVNAARAEETLRELSSEELRDAGDLFSGIVSRSAGLAALRAVSAETERLERMLHAFEQSKTSNVRRRSYCRLHIEIAVAAQSPRLYQATLQLLGELAAPLWNSASTAAEIPPASYRPLIDAIIRRDAPLSRETAHRLVETENRVLIDQHLRLMADERRRSAAS